jgi:hypothetical protein
VAGGRSGARSLIEADIGGNELGSAALTGLENAVEYENHPAIKRSVAIRASRSQPKEVRFHEISMHQGEMMPATQ